MNVFKTLTIDGQTYSPAPCIEDDTVAADTTWSSQKLNSRLGDISAALDGVLEIQNALMGGDEA